MISTTRMRKEIERIKQTEAENIELKNKIKALEKELNNKLKIIEDKITLHDKEISKLKKEK